MNQKPSANKNLRLVFNLIFAAMLGSIGAYVVIAHLVTAGGRQPAKIAPPAGAVLLAAAAVSLAAGMMLPNIALKEKTLRKAGTKSAAIVSIFGIAVASFAMMDFVAVMALVMAFITMNPQYIYPGAAAAALGLFVVRSRFAEWFDKVESMFPME